ncbi:MAG: hypothetical protein M1297_09095 [Nitrospirae bacterium]|nr:hypothetical protein [Nitrospirota bacterium]
MVSVKVREGDFVLDLSRALRWERFDRAGSPVPQGMSLVDFMVEEQRQTILLEIKDPFQTPDHRTGTGGWRRPESFRTDRLIHQSLVPKIRDSYTWLHLMGKSVKPILFVVLLGFDRIFPDSSALLVVFKDRLLARIRREGPELWKVPYVRDCLVLDPASFVRAFPQYPLFRQSVQDGGDEPAQEI